MPTTVSRLGLTSWLTPSSVECRFAKGYFSSEINASVSSVCLFHHERERRFAKPGSAATQGPMLMLALQVSASPCQSTSLFVLRTSSELSCDGYAVISLHICARGVEISACAGEIIGFDVPYGLHHGRRVSSKQSCPWLKSHQRCVKNRFLCRTFVSTSHVRLCIHDIFSSDHSDVSCTRPARALSLYCLRAFRFAL